MTSQYKELLERLQAHYVFWKHPSDFGGIQEIDTQSLTDDLDAAAAAIRALGSRVLEWIPVSERLPEWYVWVLCYNENLDHQDRTHHNMRFFQARKVETGDGNDGWRWNTNLTDVIEIGVTHWMPLPAPPEQEQSE